MCRARLTEKAQPDGQRSELAEKEPPVASSLSTSGVIAVLPPSEAGWLP